MLDIIQRNHLMQKGPRVMKFLTIVPCALAAVLIGVLAAPAQADECNKLTYLTFNAPVSLPGVTLPAGTYRFTHPDCSARLLRVASKDGLEVYGTFLTIPEERTTTTNEPEVVLAEMPAGSPEAMTAWFYPGETTGDMLMYPTNEAARVAEAPSQTVMVTNGAE